MQPDRAERAAARKRALEHQQKRSKAAWEGNDVFAEDEGIKDLRQRAKARLMKPAEAAAKAKRDPHLVVPAPSAKATSKKK